MERVGMAMGNECRQLHFESHEVMDELVLPMAAHKALMEPILNRTHGMLDSLVLSDNFRETTEGQIENPEKKT